MGAEVREKGFTALKTNTFTYENGLAKGWVPGFGIPFKPGRNVESALLRDIRAHLEAFREGAGPDMDIMIDLNFNASTEGYLKILREIEDLDMFWVELDTYNPDALAYIRSHSPHPISSCETLFGLREFIPYFRAQAMDVAVEGIPEYWNAINGQTSPIFNYRLSEDHTQVQVELADTPAPLVAFRPVKPDDPIASRK